MDVQNNNKEITPLIKEIKMEKIFFIGLLALAALMPATSFASDCDNAHRAGRNYDPSDCETDIFSDRYTSKKPVPKIKMAKPVPKIKMTPSSYPEVEMGEFRNTLEEALETVRRLIKEKEFGEAITKSKTVLKDLKSKTGMSPYSTVSQPILVSGVLGIKDLGKKFQDLSLNKQNKIIIAIEKSAHGNYLELLNAFKQIRSFYVKAYIQQAIKISESIYASTIKNITAKLLSAQYIPIYIVDQELVQSMGTKASFLLFDDDVVNIDHSDIFNLVLLDTAVSTKELKFTEQTYIEKLSEYKEGKLARHKIKTEELKKDAEEYRKQLPSEIEKHRKKYFACRDLQGGMFKSDMYAHAVSCLNKYKSVLTIADCKYGLNALYTDERDDFSGNCLNAVRN